MHLRLSIENKTHTFEEAVEKQYRVFELLKQYNLITEIGSVWKTMIPVEEFSQEEISSILSKQMNKYLVDKNDRNSSRIGFSLGLVGKAYNGSSVIAISSDFSKPEITGKDHVGIKLNDKKLEREDFGVIMPKFYSLSKDLIEYFDPINLVCYNSELRDLFDDYNFDYGYILYQKGEELKQRAEEKGIEVESFESGYIWKTDFSNYDNGLATVIETWELN